MFRLVVIALVVLVSTPVLADTIIQTQPVEWHVPGYTADLVFNQVDESVHGTLTSVQVSFSTWMYEGSLEWDNDSTESAEVGGTLGIRTALTSAVVRLDNGSGNPWESVFNTITDSFITDVTSGDTVGQFDRTLAGDYASLPGPSSNIAQLVTVTAFISGAYLSDFVGSGSYTLNYQAWQHQSTWTEGGTYSETSPSTAIASVQITYTTIPEPTTMALIGLAGVGAICVRRRRAARKTS